MELTSCRRKTSRLIRTWKQSEAARGTHVLERADVAAGQDMKIRRGSKGPHFLEKADIETGKDIETK